MKEADAVASTCAEGYESDLITTAAAWIAEMNNRPLFSLGPLMPLQAGTSKFSQASLDAEIASAPGGMGGDPKVNAGKKAVQFLNNALQKYGEHSVVYISFGTFFWYGNPS